MKVLTHHESFVRIDALFALKDVNLEKKRLPETSMKDIIFQAILKRHHPL